MEAVTHTKRPQPQRPVHFEDTLTFRLPSHVAGALQARAVRSGKSKSEWLRTVLSRELQISDREAA